MLPITWSNRCSAGMLPAAACPCLVGTGLAGFSIRLSTTLLRVPGPSQGCAERRNGSPYRAFVLLYLRHVRTWPVATRMYPMSQLSRPTLPLGNTMTKSRTLVSQYRESLGCCSGYSGGACYLSMEPYARSSSYWYVFFKSYFVSEY